MEPASSWILVRFVSTAPQQELLIFNFSKNLHTIFQSSYICYISSVWRFPGFLFLHILINHCHIWLSSSSHSYRYVTLFHCAFLFLFFLFMDAPAVYRSSWARDWIGATVTIYPRAVAKLHPLTHCAGSGDGTLTSTETRAAAVRFLTHWATGEPHFTVFLFAFSSWVVRLYTFSYAYWELIYLWRNVCSTPLSIFKSFKKYFKLWIFLK